MCSLPSRSLLSCGRQRWKRAGKRQIQCIVICAIVREILWEPEVRKSSYSDLGRGWGTWEGFPQGVIFRLKDVTRELRRQRKEALCVKPTKARAKALGQGTTGQFGGTAHVFSMLRVYKIQGKGWGEMRLERVVGPDYERPCNYIQTSVLILRQRFYIGKWKMMKAWTRKWGEADSCERYSGG